MLFGKAFRGLALWGLAQPGSGPGDVTSPHPNVPVGLTYEPAYPPALWDDLPYNDPRMPPFMVTHRSAVDPYVRQPGPPGWGYGSSV